MSSAHSYIKFDDRGRISPIHQALIAKEPYLVIKVTKDSFWAVKKTELEVGYGNLQSGLKSPSNKISPFRWKHINFFILIQPNVHQLYLAANLWMPHYHLLPEQLGNFSNSALEYGFKKMTFASFQINRTIIVHLMLISLIFQKMIRTGLSP